MLNIKEKIKSTIKHSGFRRYFSNTSWMISEQLLRMVAGLLVGIWVARYLGPSNLGLYSYVLAFTSIFSVFSTLGLEGIVVREIVKKPDKIDAYLGTSFWLRILGALSTFLIIFLILNFTNNKENVKVFILIVASGFIVQCFDVVDYYYQAKVLAKYISICKLIQLLISSCVKIYLVLNHFELIWFIGVVLFDQVTFAVSLAIAYFWQNNQNFYFKFNLDIAKKLLKDSWPLILSGFMVLIYLRIDKIMLKEMLGVSEVGIYAAATRLSEVWYFIPMLISKSLFPAIIAAKKINEELYLQRLQKLYDFLFIVALCIAIPMTFCSKWLIVLLYGTAFESAGTVLMVHIWTGIFVFLGVASSKWYLTENLQHLAFWRTFYGALVNVGLNFLLIKPFGAVGAAIATLVAQAMATFVFDAFSKKTMLQFKMKLRVLVPLRKKYV